MTGAFLDLQGRGLDIEEGASAARAGDILGLGLAHARTLQDIVGERERLRRGGRRLARKEVTVTVDEQAAGEDRGLDEARLEAGVEAHGIGDGGADPQRGFELSDVSAADEFAVSARGVQAILRLRRGEHQATSGNRREFLRERRECRAIEVGGENRVMLRHGVAPDLELHSIGGGEGLHDHQAAAGAVEGEVGRGEARLDEQGRYGLSEGLAQGAQAGGVGGVFETHQQAFGTDFALGRMGVEDLLRRGLPISEAGDTADNHAGEFTRTR